MTLLNPNPPWHHTILDQNVIDRILEAIPKVIIKNQIAHLCGIYPQRLYDWLKFGKRDMEAGVKNSIYADFYQQYHEKRAEVLHEKLQKLASCPKNYGAITFILQHCFKDEFEVKSEAHKQLEDYVLNVIKPLLSKGELGDGLSEAKERTSEAQTEEIRP